MELVSLICLHYAQKGNSVASAILIAALVEALERRADAAFQVIRTEEERNLWFRERTDGKKARREYTDMIKELGEQGYPINYGKLTLDLYKAIGKLDIYKRWKVCPDQQNAAKLANTGFRDTLCSEQLRVIKEAEMYIVVSVEDYGLSLDEAFEKAERRYTK